MRGRGGGGLSGVSQRMLLRVVPSPLRSLPSSSSSFRPPSHLFFCFLLALSTDGLPSPSWFRVSHASHHVAAFLLAQLLIGSSPLGGSGSSPISLSLLPPTFLLCYSPFSFLLHPRYLSPSIFIIGSCLCIFLCFFLFLTIIHREYSY